MLWTRDIRKGIEVMVADFDNPNLQRKARVLRTYPKPSNWLVVQYDDGNIEQVEEKRVTTMFELNDKGLL